MNKIYLFIILIFLTVLIFLNSTNLFAQIKNENKKDSTNQNHSKVFKIKEIEIFSIKETNSLDKIPNSISKIQKSDIEEKQIQNIRNLSVTVPNLFVPDYGSKMSNAVYMRGVGSRNSGQTVGIYVDNIPLLDKTNFNFDFFDIQQIEVLRGTQNTLYGQNSMSGIINIYTISPFAFQGTKLEIGGGNYGFWNFKASHYHLFSDKIGISFGGFFNKSDGFFTNNFHNSKADNWKNFGGKIKFDAAINEKIVSQTILNFENSNQNAFPYGFYDEISNIQNSVSINDKSSYKQNTFTVSEMLDFSFDNFSIISTTAFQNLSDEMFMDQDFTSEPIFTLNQIQKRNSITEEIIFKSKINNSKSNDFQANNSNKINNLSKNNFLENYNWNFGLFGSYSSLKTAAGVLFEENGVQKLIENNINANLPTFPPIIYDILDKNLPINNDFDNSTSTVAIYHQSTVNNLFINDLNLTAGIRFNYEINELKYKTNTNLQQSYSIQQGQRQIADTMLASVLFDDSAKKNSFQILPKFALSYLISSDKRIYGSISRGYKSGGFNIQMLSDLAQNDLRADMIEKIKLSIFDKLSTVGMPPETINSVLSQIPDVKRVENLSEKLWYEPEYCWNFELGGNFNFFDNKLNTSISLYYMDLQNIQITQFSPNGFGRMLSNAGKVASKGFEISLNAQITDNFALLLDYGFANAEFTDYRDTIFSEIDNKNIEINYSGNKIPYAPQHTVSLSGKYSHSFSNFFIDKFSLNLQYLGTGDIFWNELNSLSQGFYNVLNGKLVFEFSRFEIEFWAKNITNTKFQAFYFETLGNKFFQMSRPFHFGISLKMEI